MEIFRLQFLQDLTIQSSTKHYVHSRYFRLYFYFLFGMKVWQKKLLYFLASREAIAQNFILGAARIKITVQRII